MDQSELTAYLFDIQGFSVHDGPGCRTLVFLKGCSMRCQWCSNPEGRALYPEPLYRKQVCNADKLCIAACPHQAIEERDSGLVFNRSICATCLTHNCKAACCTSALNISGYPVTIEELFVKIQRDRQYWGNQGGITLTGGEPFLQSDFVTAFLQRCYESYIHTAVETCGNVPEHGYLNALPFLDWMFFDLKHPDPVKHMEGTGVSNDQILRNATTIARQFNGRMIFRMVIIPGYNDHPDEIMQIAEFIRSTGRQEINILPVHHLGREKYALIGQSYYTDHFTPPSARSLLQIQQHFEQQKISCYIGSDTPF